MIYDFIVLFIGKVALDMLGLDMEVYYASEIDEHARLVSSLHHEVKHVGNVLNLDLQRVSRSKLKFLYFSEVCLSLHVLFFTTWFVCLNLVDKHCVKNWLTSTMTIGLYVNIWLTSTMTWFVCINLVDKHCDIV
jgi:hypothetical protein